MPRALKVYQTQIGFYDLVVATPSESDHFRLKKNMPRVSGFQSFNTARRSIQGFEAMLWLRKGFGSAGAWTVHEQNRLLGFCFGLPEVNEV